MCNCKNIKVGSYNNQIELYPPIYMLPIRNCIGEIKKSQTICVDKCISNEIIGLWKCEITTVGCCCGHNEVPAYIQVAEKDKSKMLEIGYQIQGGIDGCDDTCFIPKTKYMKTISDIVCSSVEVSEETLKHKGRNENTILAKTLFCWFASEHTESTHREIAEYVNLSIAAFWGSIRRYKVWYQYDKAFRNKANEIKELLK